MPLINFQCIECNKKFTELVYSHNKDNVKCPSCEGGVKQIYEGKVNSLKGSSAVPEKCHTCTMGCHH